MPLKFDIKKKLVSRSERVKSVDLHPDLPWVLAALYSGNIAIYDYQTQSTVKTIEVSNSPVRSAKFVVRKQWVVTASDDLQIRIFNYNTLEKVKSIESHTDFLRCIVVHPSQSFIISTSDDCTIKIWDWDKDFALSKTLEDHAHYVMMVAINPRDHNSFASASLDKTIKVWSFAGGNKANFALLGHQSGVNCVDYYRGDKPYIISGGDDRLVKIWDYQTKQCLHTLEGHLGNISSVLFHPELPLILTTAEDGTIKMWQSTTYKLENSLNYNMERVWCIDTSKDGSNVMAFGFDEGTMVLKIGSDEPIVSMNNGKVISAKNLEISMVNLKAINTSDDEALRDGEQVSVQTKELGNADIFPQAIKHSPNGHFFAVCSDDEYIIYRAQTFKNSGFGSGYDFVWSAAGDYAVRDSVNLKVFKGATNQQVAAMRPDFAMEGLFGGPLLCAKSKDFVVFFDWDTLKVIRRIDVSVQKLYWNDDNTLVALVSQDEFYILAYHKEVVAANIDSLTSEDGLEDAFDLQYEITDSVTSALWVGDCFFYTTQSGKMNYSIGGRVFSHIFVDKKRYLVGYMPSQGRVYLIDKHFHFVSYELSPLVAEFQSAIVGGRLEAATALLGKIPEKHYDKLARFLDQLDYKAQAYQLARDPDLKFDLAIQLGLTDEAHRLAETEGSQSKLKQVGDLALIHGNIRVAIRCLEAGNDLSGLLLIYSSLGMRQELADLARRAEEQTKSNIAFVCYFLLANLDKCVEILVNSGRLPEAAYFCKTYCPSKITETVRLWKESLSKSHPVTAQKIADPLDFPEEFKDLFDAMKIEEFTKKGRQLAGDVPAHNYLEYSELLSNDFFSTLKEDPSFKLDPKTLVPIVSEENPCLEMIHKQGPSAEVEEPVE
eukprot:TRINITY_DN516_c0_g1_i1.p1 TRINITY_DN516_c0_g1~~TRINITY_DN516_c0_g1_i1.p1  ORF type:complete len:884 (-),score=266.35 TRINITY_DN516_c0_g1_i1:3523-6174(-)